MAARDWKPGKGGAPGRDLTWDAYAFATSSTLPPAQPGDARSGEKLFKQYCSSCHSASVTSRSIAGPNLFGLFDRLPGYESAPPDVRKTLDSVTWDPRKLQAYLRKPIACIQGGRYADGRGPGESGISDIVTYILKESETGREGLRGHFDDWMAADAPTHLRHSYLFRGSVLRSIIGVEHGTYGWDPEQKRMIPVVSRQEMENELRTPWYAFIPAVIAGVLFYRVWHRTAYKMGIPRQAQGVHSYWTRDQQDPKMQEIRRNLMKQARERPFDFPNHPRHKQEGKR